MIRLGRPSRLCLRWRSTPATQPGQPGTDSINWVGLSGNYPARASPRRKAERPRVEPRPARPLRDLSPRRHGLSGPRPGTAPARPRPLRPTALFSSPINNPARPVRAVIVCARLGAARHTGAGLGRTGPECIRRAGPLICSATGHSNKARAPEQGTRWHEGGQRVTPRSGRAGWGGVGRRYGKTGTRAGGLTSAHLSLRGMNWAVVSAGRRGGGMQWRRGRPGH